MSCVEITKKIILDNSITKKVKSFGITNAKINLDSLNSNILKAIENFKKKNINDVVFNNNNKNKDLIDSIYIKQENYLSEEIALAYYKNNSELKDGVIKILLAYAENKNGLFFPYDKTINNNPEKKGALDNIIENIKCADGQNDKLYKSFETLLVVASDREKKSKETTHKQIPLKEKISAFKTEFENDRLLLRYEDIIILPSKSNVFIIGDTHGDNASTKNIITSIVTSDDFLLKYIENKAFIVFLGDYVNNGLKSIENLITVLELKKKYPKNVILLNGNHEFRETYFTAFNEYFITHWDNSINNSFPKKDKPNNHYNHIRFEMVQKFGIVRGEEIYDKFKEWGRSLPYICFATDGIMMSHSIGKHEGVELSLESLSDVKKNDIELIEQLGYEAWKKTYKKEYYTQHSAMVNNREIDKKLIKEFAELFEETKRKTFFFGHSHYRSGDIIKYGDYFFYMTICSSKKDSEDAGHYMYQEMDVERMSKRFSEGLSINSAKPFYISYTYSNEKSPFKVMEL